jgi:hypothetical protein
MASRDRSEAAMRALSIWSAIALGVWSHGAHAYRPFDSTDASVVEPSSIEIEFGPLDYTDVPAGSVTEIPAVTINAGLSSRWEVVIDATRAISRSAATRDVETFEAAVLLKGVLREGALQDATGWSVATEFGVLLPTRNLDDDYGATFALIGSRRDERTVVHLNAAVAQNRDGNAELFSGVILEGVTHTPVRPVAEITFEFEEGPDTSRYSALVGAIWRHMDNLSFDIAVRAIREDGAWSHQGRIGLTWAFAVARS